MNSPRVTMGQIAARLGITKSAVSLALRNHHRISQKTRDAVRKAAEELGYVPDPFLGGLAAYRKHQAPVRFQSTIAWINRWKRPEELRRGFGEFDAYWRGASEAARRLGFSLEDIFWEPKCSGKRFEQILLTRGVQGILIPPHRENNEGAEWANFDWSKFSIIRFGLSVPIPDSNLVTSDQYRGVIMACSRIHEYGYKRLGLIVGDELDRRVLGGYSGAYLRAHEQLGIEPLPVLKTNHSNATAKELLREKSLLERWLRKHKPDAVLTTDAETPRLIRELGYRIPQDIAIAGTSVLDIPVDTGIDQHSEAIGRIAVEMLLKQIYVNERGEPLDPVRILVESRWKDGKSLPPLNAAVQA